MKLKVQSIHFDADNKLLEFIQEKVDKLTHFNDAIIGGEVYLRIENSANTANKITEIKLNIPGTVLFAKEQCKSFEEAADLAVTALKKQLTKHKERVRV